MPKPTAEQEIMQGLKRALAKTTLGDEWCKFKLVFYAKRSRDGVMFMGLALTEVNNA